MAFLPTGFDARQVQPATELGALPAGEYIVTITDSAMEPTKNGSGQFLKLVFTVLDGAHKGAKVFDRLNLINTNQTAVEIAQRALSAICHAVQVFVITDSEQLHDKPLKIKISYEPAKGEFGEQNRVKAYKPLTAALLHSAAPVSPVSPVQNQRTVTPPASATRPVPTAATGRTPSWRQIQAKQEQAQKEAEQADDIPY